MIVGWAGCSRKDSDPSIPAIRSRQSFAAAPGKSAGLSLSTHAKARPKMRDQVEVAGLRWACSCTARRPGSRRCSSSGQGRFRGSRTCRTRRDNFGSGTGLQWIRYS